MSSKDQMQEILGKLANADFREKFSSNPQNFLKDYPQLTEEQKTVLTEMAKGFASDKKTSKTSWWPSSFKELGAFIFSAALIVLLGYVIWSTYSMMPNPPQVLQVGNTTQVVDSFGRAKDTLNILFPLFAAVVTFWLGVAVESKRGDQMAVAADNASQSKTATKVRATSELASTRGQLMQQTRAAGLAEDQRDRFEELIRKLYEAEIDVANS